MHPAHHRAQTHLLKQREPPGRTPEPYNLCLRMSSPPRSASTAPLLAPSRTPAPPTDARLHSTPDAAGHTPRTPAAPAPYRLSSPPHLRSNTPRSPMPPTPPAAVP